MIPAADVMPLVPNGVNSDRLSEFQPCRPSTTNSASTESLISTITVLTRADSLAPRISSRVQSPMRTTAGRLNTPPCSGALEMASGSSKPNQAVEQPVEVLRPADGDRGGGDAVLEQQARGDHDGDALPERRVGVGIGGAGDRDGARELGVADRGEAGDDAGEDEREDHRRPGDRHRLREHDEDAGADRRADAEEGELEEADRAVELAALRVRPRLLRHRGDGLAPQQLLAQRRGSSWHRCHRSSSVCRAPARRRQPNRGRARACPRTSRGARRAARRRPRRRRPEAGGCRCSCSAASSSRPRWRA